MPVVTMLPNGCSTGVCGHNGGKFGEKQDIQGWTASSSRGNTKFLQSVNTWLLDGEGWSFTLTAPKIPASPGEWARWRNVFLNRLMRDHGAVRIHWVTEWQRRGAPHLHGSIYFADKLDTGNYGMIICRSWVVGNPFGRVLYKAQKTRPIFSMAGWAQYCAKHCARGVQHYQRSNDHLPKLWKGNTGRLWGYRGEWPIEPEARFDLEAFEGDKGWFVMRRLQRRYECALKAKKKDWAGLAYARRSLKCNDFSKAHVRGNRFWHGFQVTDQFICYLADEGFSVRVLSEDGDIDLRPFPSDKTASVFSGNNEG
jgi:hypothetical protein